MRPFFVVLVALLIPACASEALTPPSLPAGAAAVLSVRDAWTTARDRKDPAEWSRYVGDDYIFTDDTGDVQTNATIFAQWAKADATQITVVVGKPEDLRVLLYEDTAVVNYREKWDDTIGGQHHASYSRLTEVYRRLRGRWKLIARQETGIPNSATPVGTAHPEGYDDYVGVYRVGPAFCIKVTRDGDKLFEQWPGEDSPTELLPLADSWFFSIGQAGAYEFVRDSRGAVITHRYRDSAGDILGTKIADTRIEIAEESRPMSDCMRPGGNGENGVHKSG